MRISFLSIILVTTLLLSHSFLFSGVPAQDSIVQAFEASEIPVIDGIGNDACWAGVKWQPIDEVWIPWGQKIDTSDFKGQYKISWSSKTNLLYFIVEITDDTISDHFIKDASAPVYNFDMFEVFIDEDKSGGYHSFDGKANNEEQLGTNAENAFAYHIFAKSPAPGQMGSSFYAFDMIGTGWNDKIDISYDWHFPEFKYRMVTHTTTYEFSLMVFNDTYSLKNEKAARVTLTPGKILGLTLAANDDDQPDVDPVKTVRDNMIGSVAVTKEHYNDHWKNADDFGTVKLVGKK